ncbi:MAG: class I SAM-dependent methyltransferase [Gammaproteobacteria bacterium]|jgi:ubiquinone/menaquinone biosynthesis C-methylase UbiE
MQRIPEPELMDDPAQAKAYADADFSEPNVLFSDIFKAHFGSVDFGGYIVDLGCGPADIALRLARAYRHCHVHGVDGSEPMLRIATERVVNASLSDRIALFQCTMPRVVVPRACYDAVISNSLLHHLANPCSLWNVIKRLATSGAPILVMDLMRPPDHNEVARLVSVYAADAPAVLMKDFERSLLAAYSIDEVVEQLAVAKLDYLNVRVVSDRHFTVAGRFHG